MEEKVKVIIDDQVTKALADIQDPEEYEIVNDGLDELDEFIFDRQEDEKMAPELLLVVRNMRKLIRRLSGVK